jgi:hypothetical protein
MKLSSILSASIAIVATISFTADAASAAPDTTHNVMAGSPSQTCDTGQTWDAAAHKCIAVSSINYNASKSNTGNNITFPGNGGAANRSMPTTSPRYHCGKNEYMLSNGDCVPNPPSKPND